MVSYQYLYTFIALNFILLFAVFLSGILSKKAARLRDTLTAVIWLIFSWYYKLRLSHHLPADIHSRHYDDVPAYPDIIPDRHIYSVFVA